MNLFILHLKGKNFPLLINNEIKFLFIGRLDDRKSIIELCRVFSEIPIKNISLSIIGNGIYKEEIEKLTKTDSRFNFLGFKSRDEVSSVLSSHDVLILPSKFDGWGAVVSEALMKGMRCIVSDTAGSHSLIKNRPELGSVFESQNWIDLRQKIIYQIKKGPQTLCEKQQIIEYSKSISSVRAADYLVEIIDYLYGKSTICPMAPWASLNQ